MSSHRDNPLSSAAPAHWTLRRLTLRRLTLRRLTVVAAQRAGRLAIAGLFVGALVVGLGGSVVRSGGGFQFEVATAAADDLADDEARRAKDIIRSTMSPFCPGTTLEGCSSSYAGGWRKDIRTWVKAGVPTQEIRTRLAARMPEQDLTGAPSTALDGVMPVLAGIAALVLLIALFRRLLRPAPSAALKSETQAKPARRSEEELDKQLDAELAALDD